MPRAARVDRVVGRATAARSAPSDPWNVQVALMLPRQPACSALSVGSIITTSSASSGSRSSSGVSALSVDRAAPRGRRTAQPNGAPGQRELDHHGQRALHVAGAEPVHALAVAPAGDVVLGRHGVQVAGEQHRGAPAGRASRQVSPRSLARRAAERDVRRQRRLVARLATGCRPARASARPGARRAWRRRSAGMGRRLPYARCATAASTSRPGPDNQQLVHAARAQRHRRASSWWRRSTRPATVEQVARTIQGFGRGEAVVGDRRAVRSPAGSARARRAAARAGSACPTAATSACGSATPLLFRRGLPLYPVPRRGSRSAASERGWRSASSCSRRSRRSAATCPDSAQRRATRARWATPAMRSRARCSRPTRTRSSARCSATARRPSARRGACSSGSRRSSCKGVYDEDGGLWHRTLDEIDACAAAYAAYALSVGLRDLGRRSRARA